MPPTASVPARLLGKAADIPALGWRYSRMFREARKSRLTMLQRLDGYADREDETIDLYVPLSVDMEPGVIEPGEPTPKNATPLEQFDVQVLLSEASLRHTLGIDGIVLPMIGFDPHRTSEDPRNNYEEVQRRIIAGEAIGVKLYPPMGFRPIGNTTPHIDDRLNELYRFCVEYEVPIVAHCSPANAVVGSENDARPCNWRKVLDDHPGLRLNLAHVGGLGSNGWAEEAIGVIADYQDGPSIVTADISNHDIASEADIRAFLCLLESSARAVSAEPSRVLSRLAFGSDYWFLHMHARPKRFLEKYRKLIASHFKTQPALIDSIFGGTALDFLGLNVSGNRNRARLMDHVDRLQTNKWGPFTPPESYSRIITPRPHRLTQVVS